MKKLFYSIEVRNKDSKPYKTSTGQKVIDFTFEDDISNEPFVEVICRNEFAKYQAVCKEGSLIDIEVRLIDEISNTYSVLYSFYGAENKFVKH